MVTIYGGLDGGLHLEALMPRHLAGNRHPVVQHMILTQGDSVELAKQLAVMLELHNSKDMHT